MFVFLRCLPQTPPSTAVSTPPTTSSPAIQTPPPLLPSTSGLLLSVRHVFTSVFPSSHAHTPRNASGNSRLPQWAQTNRVNLYLFHADSGDQVLNVTNVVNPTSTAGQHHVQIDDRWWGSRGENWNGQNVSFPFYWLITRNDRPIENSDIPQATFTAVRECKLCAVSCCPAAEDVIPQRQPSRTL